MALTTRQQQFVSDMLPYAMEASQMTGVAPEVIIAQAAHESAWGSKAPGNNYFGIKGGGQTLATSEYVNGKKVGTTAGFRTYATPEESFLDWAQLMTGKDRYQPVLDAPDAAGQIKALGESGYATDPRYASKVGSIANRVAALVQAAPAFDPDTLSNALQAFGYGEQPYSSAVDAVNAEASGQQPQPAGLATLLAGDTPSPRSVTSPLAAGYINASPRPSPSEAAKYATRVVADRQLQEQLQAQANGLAQPTPARTAYSSPLPSGNSAPPISYNPAQSYPSLPSSSGSSPALVATGDPYDPFGTKVTGKDQSRMPQYGGTSSAVAAPMPVPPAAAKSVGTWQPMTPAMQSKFDTGFAPGLDSANYSGITNKALPTLADFLGGQIKQPAPPPVIQAQPAAPKAAVKAPVSATRLPAAAPAPAKKPGLLGGLLANPLARAGLGFAMGGPLGALLGGASALIAQNGGLSKLLGSGVLPLPAGTTVSPWSGSGPVYYSNGGNTFSTASGGSAVPAVYRSAGVSVDAGGNLVSGNLPNLERYPGT